MLWIVDCKWSRFSVWTSCSLTCGGGMRTSSRTIVEEAMNGGKECVGKNVRAEKCSTKPCPGNFMRISLKKRSFYHYFANTSSNSTTISIIRF